MNNRATGRLVTTAVVAVAIAIVAFPVAVYAATGSLINITDPVHASQKARVDSSGRLLVNVNGVLDSRMGVPAKPWSRAFDLGNPSDVVFTAMARVVYVTSLTVTPTGVGDFHLTQLTVPGDATDCTNILSVQQIYAARNLSVGAPLAAAFPTPLRIAPNSGHKQCIIVQGPGMAIDVSGFTA
jgi:hypothetical protein